jgi:hypothetical protein
MLQRDVQPCSLVMLFTCPVSPARVFKWSLFDVLQSRQHKQQHLRDASSKEMETEDFENVFRTADLWRQASHFDSRAVESSLFADLELDRKPNASKSDALFQH